MCKEEPNGRGSTKAARKENQECESERQDIRERTNILIRELSNMYTFPNNNDIEIRNQ